MAIHDIGALRGADESLSHQIVDTFGTVGESDYAWTEKIWVSMESPTGGEWPEYGLTAESDRAVSDL